MELEPIRLVKFDIHGTEPLNTFEGEVHKLKDKTCPWIIPNGSPFFADPAMVVLYDQRGALMKLDRDYFIQGEFTPFCAATGQSICSFIELSPDILRDNEEVKIDYQSIGAWFVPRSNLQEWLDAIHKGVRPIDWSKVFGVPPTLPPEYHLHNATTEITDWYELTWFFAYLEKILAQRDPQANDKITTIVEEVYGALVETRIQRLAQIVAHDENYHQPHGTNKFDILLGNHDNYPTATFAEELAGLRNDVFSTPRGVAELAKTYRVDTSAAMLQGIMPLSQFAGKNYIPPNITGSFEAQGGVTETSGICKDPTGRVAVISSHFDGRVKGLYYSFIDNYDKDDFRLAFSGYLYAPPSLANLGITCDRIVTGSGNDVIMVGQQGTGNWYIALTNGTFDPASHKYVKCDISNIISVKGINVGVYPELMKLHYMGEYILMTVGYALIDGLIANNNYIHFFVIPTSSIRAGTPVSWQQKNVSYQDYYGNTRNGVAAMSIAEPVGGSGNISQCGGLLFTPLPAEFMGGAGVVLPLTAPKKGVRGVYYFHIMQIQSGYRGGKTAGSAYEVYYEFNIATGVFTKLGNSPIQQIDFNKDQEELYKAADFGLPLFSPAISSWWGQSTTVLPSGEILTAHRNAGNAFPVNIQYLKFEGYDNASDLLSGSLHPNRVTAKRVSNMSPVSMAPIPAGTAPTNLSYDTDGELWSAQALGTPNRKVFMRRVTGEYAVRPGVNNLTLGANILSRPLTNDVFNTNLSVMDGIVSITGTAASLTSGGVEAGSSALSMCGYSSNYPVSEFLPLNPALRAPVPGDMVMTFPRTHKRALDTVNRMATYSGDTFFGFRQNVFDQIKAFIPGGYSAANGWAFTLTMLNAENGGMFQGSGIALVQIDFFGGSTSRSRLVTVRPVVEAPNDNHPGIYLITGLTVLATPSHMLTAPSIISSVGYKRNDESRYEMPGMAGYRDGNILTGYLVGGWWAAQTGNSHRKITSVFTVDLTTGAVSFLIMHAYARSYLDPEPVAMIPKVGMTDLNYSGSGDTYVITPAVPTQFAYTGETAYIVRKGQTYYLTMSCYLDSAWVLFFLEEVAVLVNGASYTFPKGSIDLRDITPEPQNKTFYIYATVEDDRPKYLVSTSQMRKAGNMLRVAKLVTNDKQILTIERYQPLMVGSHQLSYTREGGIIPISSGFPQDEGDFIFLRNAELLP